MPSWNRIAFLILLAASAACFSIAAYALSNIGVSAQGFTTLFLYVVLPVCVGLAFVYVLRFGRLRRHLALNLIALGVALLAAEAYLQSQHVTRDDLRSRASVAWGIPDDSRDRLQVIKDFEKEGQEAYPPIVSWRLMESQPDGTSQSTIRIDGKEVMPLAGISNVLTVACNEIGFWLTFAADRHGFNNPSGMWTGDKPDLVMLGDSFTFGNCVPSDQHFSNLIRRQHPRSLNLGYVNWGPIATYATLVEYGGLVSPKTVLWFFFEGNDMLNLTAESNVPLLVQYLEGNFKQNLVGKQAKLDKALKVRVNRLREEEELKRKQSDSRMTAVKNVAKLLLLREVRKTIGIKSFMKENRQKVWLQHPELLEKVLGAADKTTRSWGGCLHVVYLPAWRRGRDVDEALPYYKTVRKTVLEIGEKLGIPVLDLVPRFVGHPEPKRLNSYPGRGGHYSSIGYQLVANSVLSYLATNGNEACKSH